MKMINYSSIPKSPGIYYLYENEVLLYIGRSKNLHSRLITHRSANKKAFQDALVYPDSYSRIDLVYDRVTKISIEEYPEDALEWIEAFLIWQNSPIINSQIRGHYEPLKELEQKIYDEKNKRRHQRWKEMQPIMDKMFKNHPSSKKIII